MNREFRRNLRCVSKQKKAGISLRILEFSAVFFMWIARWVLRNVCVSTRYVLSDKKDDKIPLHRADKRRKYWVSQKNAHRREQWRKLSAEEWMRENEKIRRRRKVLQSKEEVEVWPKQWFIQQWRLNTVGYTLISRFFCVSLVFARHAQMISCVITIASQIDSKIRDSDDTSNTLIRLTFGLELAQSELLTMSRDRAMRSQQKKLN